MAGIERKLGTWELGARSGLERAARHRCGHFVTLTYESQFSKGPATEQFTWRIDHGAPASVGYNIKSNLL